ncbi:MAG: sigma-54-dependent Fis family transcriptional regulator [Lentisphaeria bacterium]|nr:sigma-54 dependent transcriptional regulator [Lentisphaeria bacterium]NQZ66652.1 sigma-54-dependent Fis family transcriptional regulator [Lentisphaeria bacterium]
MTKAKILIVDDEKNTREGLKKALQQEYDTTLADNGKLGMELIVERSFDLVLTDLRMPDMDGMQLLERLQAMDKPPLCIMLTAYGNSQIAKDSIKNGAYDYLEKPVDLDDLEKIIRNALESKHLQDENKQLKKELASQFAFERIIGHSPEMTKIMDTVKQVAATRTTVLLTGESGTGKEEIARALHQLSDRANKPFVPIHCAALTASLLESELFGYEKGAFTGASERKIGRFEAADGGTVFLDEISEIDPAAQVKLLRVLETRTFERVGSTDPITVDIRLIAASNRNLKKMVADGDFREDLYYRLDVLNIHLPPLRERIEDISLLLLHFLKIYNEENNKSVDGFTPDALKILECYNWPGNIRQLKNCVERMLVLSRNDKFTIKDIPQDIRDSVDQQPEIQTNPKDTLDMEANEKYLIQKALEECKGNRTKAAEKLGISRRTLHRKLHQFDLR